MRSDDAITFTTMRDTDEFLQLTEAFTSAALGVASWNRALEDLSTATGSRAAQLIAFDGQCVAVNLFTGLDPGIHAEYVRHGRADPGVNPRVRVGHEGALLRVVAEEDFITPAERARSRHYQEFASRWDIPWSAIAPLTRTGRDHVVLAVFRSERQGHVGRREKRAFQAVVPHVHGALRLERALASEGPRLAAGVFESLSMAAFICDRDGVACGLTPTAEALVSRGSHLALRGGVLHAANGADAAALRTAMLQVADSAGRAPTTRAVLLHARDAPDRTLVVDVFALPRRGLDLPHAPRVLIVARGGTRRRAEAAALLKTAYGLSDAEVDVALALADGDAVPAIAAARGVGVATVRTQVKSVFAKLGVHRRAELTAHLNSLR